MREALEAALNSGHHDLFSGAVTTKREAVVAALLDKAAAGNVAAIKAVFEYVDGPSALHGTCALREGIGNGKEGN